MKKNILFLLLLGFINHNLKAQFGERQFITKCKICSPLDIIAADLDGDKLPEVVTASDRGFLMYYQNKGDNGFASDPILISDEFYFMEAINAGDIDGDGDMDLIIASGGDHSECSDCKVGWFKNDGKGNFSKLILIDNDARNATSIQAVDFNADGKMDIICASYVQGRVVYYQNQDGAGDEFKIVEFSRYKDMVARVFDMNQDGRMDILSVNRNKRLEWRYQMDNGRLSPRIPIEITQRSFSRIHAADVDNDGQLEALASDYNDKKVRWYGVDTTFALRGGIVIKSDKPIADITNADLDLDGDEDVIVSYRDNQITWCINDGNGTFSETIDIPTTMVHVLKIKTADIDQDGDYDILAISLSDEQLAWYQNDGKGNFREKIISRMATLEPTITIATDLDSDGDQDILTACRDKKIVWHENDGIGRFSKPKLITDSAEYVKSMKVHDLDQDGDQDIIAILAKVKGNTSATYDYKLGWYENEGQAIFKPYQVLLKKKWIFTFQLADIDRDKDIDIVAFPTTDDNDEALYLNNGNQIFVGHPIIQQEKKQRVQSIHQINLDKDKDIDFIGLVYDKTVKVAQYKNNGKGKFSRDILLQTTDAEERFSVKQMHLTDIDNDGDKDITLAVKNHNSSKFPNGSSIVCYRNNKRKGFDKPEILLMNREVHRMAWKDIDADGDLDFIFFYDGDNEELAWYQNDGTGKLSKRNDLDNMNESRWSWSFADLDGDEDLEMLISVFFDNLIAYYENLSN